jgi:acyl carrier protein
MTRDIESALHRRIRGYLPKNSAGDPDDLQDLFESGILDSAGLVSFTAEIEREFQISIRDEDLLPENFQSIAAMAAYIRSRRNCSGSDAPG